jgi:hypothetical protein
MNEPKPTVVECQVCHHLFVRAEMADHLTTHETHGLPHLDTCQLKYGGIRCTCGLFPDTEGKSDA